MMTGEPEQDTEYPMEMRLDKTGYHEIEKKYLHNTKSTIFV